MGYSPSVRDLLEKIGAEEGDVLQVRKDGREHSGVLMPHHEFSDADVIVIKLKSGYNIGIKVTSSTLVSMQSKGSRKERAPKVMRQRDGLKDIAILGTGGTIASYVDYRTGAVHPALSAEELAATIPEIAEVCNVKAKVLFSIFSENMKAESWQNLANEVADRLNEGVEGCLVPHGTDTMGYTSAALSFMLGDVPKPVILVGAQRSSDRPSSDAYVNLLCATKFAVQSEVAEVLVMMHETPSDSTVVAHRGTKARKMHTSRRDAFESINSRPLARIFFEENRIEYLSNYRKKNAGRARANTKMESDVSLLFFYPGMKPSAFRDILQKHRGVVIAGSGLGHVSSDMIHEVRSAIDNGTTVVMTSQCLFGRVNLNVYNTGRDLITAGVIPGEDMLPETAYVKLMWVLGQTSDEGEIQKMMTSDLRGEITERREIDE